MSSRIAEAVRAFDQSKDGYNKRAVKEARSLLRSAHLLVSQERSPLATGLRQLPFQGKTYVHAPGDYLYVLAARNQPAIKIGHSIEPEARIAAIESELKMLLEPVLLLPEMGFVENAIHHIFWDYRIAGEWFSWELTLKRWVEEMRAFSFAGVVTRYDLAAKLAAKRLAATQVYPPEPIAA